MSEQQPPVSPLITCEHASNRVPVPWRWLFVGEEHVLDGHRGHDIGATDLALRMSGQLHAPLLAGRVTRLLVDLNRSASHPARFSPWSRRLEPAQRAHLAERWWEPHWRAYREWVDRLPGLVVHIACHSFTPVLNGKQRQADIGLLYDPSRRLERDWCVGLAGHLREQLPDLRIRRNYPYRGTSNGLGQQHRWLYPPQRLITMEIEFNQALAHHSDWPALRAGIVEACRLQLQATHAAGAAEAAG